MDGERAEKELDLEVHATVGGDVGDHDGDADRAGHPEQGCAEPARPGARGSDRVYSSRISRMKHRLQGSQTSDRLVTADLRNAQAFGSTWERVTFEDVDFGCADLRNTKLLDCRFYRCNLAQADLSMATIQAARFFCCSMDQARFLSTVAADVHVDQATLQLSAWTGAMLKDVHFAGCDLRWALLDFATGERLSFNHCNLQSARIPMNCQFWNAAIDEKTLGKFLAMVARIHPDSATRSKLSEIAGERTTRAVERMMRIEREDVEF